MALLTSLKQALPAAAAKPLASYSRRSRLVYRAKVRSAGRQCDVFLVSFPKVGRTWLRVLIGKCLQEQYGLRRRRLLAVTRAKVTAPGMTRILATHDDATQDKPFRHIQKDKRPYRDHRVIFLVRDPRDVIVSHYFHQTRRRADPYRGTLAQFLQEPNGSLDTIIAFYNAWANQRHVPAGFLLLRYEDLRRDPAGILRRALDFLGEEGIGEDAIRRAVEFASFERSQERERREQLKLKALSAWDPDDPESYKARRGVVGGYVDYLTEPEIAEMNRRLQALHPLFGYQQPAAEAGPSVRARDRT